MECCDGNAVDEEARGAPSGLSKSRKRGARWGRGRQCDGKRLRRTGAGELGLSLSALSPLVIESHDIRLADGRADGDEEGRVRAGLSTVHRA